MTSIQKLIAIIFVVLAAIVITALATSVIAIPVQMIMGGSFKEAFLNASPIFSVILLVIVLYKTL